MENDPNLNARPSPLQPAAYVQPIHFEDLQGAQFERLVFAYHARTDRWLVLEWFGQQGKDKGRDILGKREVDGRKDGETLLVLCANWQKLTSAKVINDIDKALKSPSGIPNRIRVVCGHDIPAGVRDKVKAHASANGIYTCELWSGKEFEEHLRARAESLLLRFVHGEAFPDAAAELELFAWGTLPVSDQERVALIARAFDRPAFTTPIHQESSLPAFKQAVNDTIEVLKTGVWQTRGGTVIRRLPTKNDIQDRATRSALSATEANLVRLRTVFDGLLRTNAIKHCQCNDPDCPTYFMNDEAAAALTDAREQVLVSFRKACPMFLRDLKEGVDD